MGLQLNELKVVALKVNLLFDKLVPQTKQVAFNLEWNQILEKILDKALDAATTAQLQLPDPKESRLLVPQGALKTEGALPGG